VAPRARRSAAMLALAAALVLAVAGSIVVLMRVNDTSPQAPAPAAAPAAPGGNAVAPDAVESVEAEFRLAEQHYQNAIAKLEEAAKSDDDTIDAQTAAALQKNLQVIDQAIAESRAALRQEPQSTPARDSLFEALRRKVLLLQDTIALMNEMRKGDSAGAAQILNSPNKS
jgi:tetratricopeptide (TPR) repeat protein